jgi:mannitol 2-dehydrogenase
MARDTMSADVTSEPVELKRATLSALPASVRVPAYDHAAVAPGIVHLGLGGFHRAHMARYTHDLMQLDPSAREWGIAGAGLMPSDRRMIDSLAPQDGLYTLVERSGTEETACVIGSIAEVIFAGESSAALLSAIDRPAIRIVSLTVTENGYCLDPATKQLNPEHPLVRADLADPARPKSAIGIIVEALRRRRDGGRPPFTALTCDNIQGNGEVLREAVLAHPLLRDAELADWIAREVSFPSTMVDRITPVTAAEEIETLATRHGVRDRWPVFCETFTQWVIEDRFPLGRPAWERVGAQFVDDVAPYEFMKLRLLNASHLAVSGLGRLAGYVTIDGSMADPRIAGIMAALMDRETGPTLPPVPGIDIPAYKRTLIERQRRRALERPRRPDPGPSQGRRERGAPGPGARRLAAARARRGRARRADPGAAPDGRAPSGQGRRGRPGPDAAPVDPAPLRQARRGPAAHRGGEGLARPALRVRDRGDARRGDEADRFLIPLPCGRGWRTQRLAPA